MSSSCFPPLLSSKTASRAIANILSAFLQYNTQNFFLSNISWVVLTEKHRLRDGKSVVLTSLSFPFPKTILVLPLSCALRLIRTQFYQLIL